MVAGGRIGIRAQFPVVADMDAHIVEQWNRLVRPQDKGYWLGDITLGRAAKDLEIVRQLKGHLRLILGNHDRQPVQHYLDAEFEKVMAYREFAGILFSHIPVHPCQFVRFKGNVHGHTHESFVIRPQLKQTHNEPVLCALYPESDPRYLKYLRRAAQLPASLAR